MRVLLTGANGFIGAWTLRRLVDAGAQVQALDRDAPGPLVQRLLGDALDRIAWARADVCEAEPVDAACAGCEAIVHLAGVLTPACRDDPVRGALVNVVGTVNVFEAARRHGVGRVVYASSAAVYGPDHAAHPEPVTHYGAFKLACEGCARSHWLEHRIASVGLRPFVVYGPGRESGASAGISLACRAAAQGQPFVIGFTGRAGMVFVDDVSATILAALRVPLAGAPVIDMPGEVCDVEAVIAEIRRICPPVQIEARGAPLPLVAEVPPGRDGQFVSGVPVTPLHAGIARTLAFYR
jgi:nucleoside-diphosphate-sugar epimerase